MKYETIKLLDTVLKNKLNFSFVMDYDLVLEDNGFNVNIYRVDDKEYLNNFLSSTNLLQLTEIKEDMNNLLRFVNEYISLYVDIDEDNKLRVVFF